MYQCSYYYLWSLREFPKTYSDTEFDQETLLERLVFLKKYISFYIKYIISKNSCFLIIHKFYIYISLILIICIYFYLQTVKCRKQWIKKLRINISILSRISFACTFILSQARALAFIIMYIVVEFHNGFTIGNARGLNHKYIYCLKKYINHRLAYVWRGRAHNRFRDRSAAVRAPTCHWRFLISRRVIGGID